MSDAMSTYLENAVVELTLRGGTYAATTVWVALFTDLASLADIEGNIQTNEVDIAGSAYARKSASFIAPVDGATNNTADIEFTQASNVWGNIRYAAVMNAQTNGEVLFFGQLAEDKQINTNDIFKFNLGDLDITVN